MKKKTETAFCTALLTFLGVGLSHSSIESISPDSSSDDASYLCMETSSSEHSSEDYNLSPTDTDDSSLSQSSEEDCVTASHAVPYSMTYHQVLSSAPRSARRMTTSEAITQRSASSQGVPKSRPVPHPSPRCTSTSSIPVIFGQEHSSSFLAPGTALESVLSTPAPGFSASMAQVQSMPDFMKPWEPTRLCGNASPLSDKVSFVFIAICNFPQKSKKKSKAKRMSKSSSLPSLTKFSKSKRKVSWLSALLLTPFLQEFIT